jgi:hypothetical protein
VRKLLAGLVMACVALGLVAPPADARESLRAHQTRQARGRDVTYSGTTSCRRVYLRSNPGGSRTALVPQTRTVRNGRFSITTRVRARAAKRRFTVVARCNNARGRLIGRTRLVVGNIAFGGAPVLPQLLLGTGLLAAGGLLLLVGRRRRWGYARRLAAWGPAVPRDSRP